MLVYASLVAVVFLALVAADWFWTRYSVRVAVERRPKHNTLQQCWNAEGYDETHPHPDDLALW